MATIDCRNFTLYVQYTPTPNNEIPIGFIVIPTNSDIISRLGTCFIVKYSSLDNYICSEDLYPSNSEFMIITNITADSAEITMRIRSAKTSSSAFDNGAKFCPLYESMFST